MDCYRGDCIIVWGVCAHNWIVQTEAFSPSSHTYLMFRHVPYSLSLFLSVLYLSLLVRWAGILLGVYTHSSNTIWVSGKSKVELLPLYESLLYGLRHIKRLSKYWSFRLTWEYSRFSAWILTSRKCLVCLSDIMWYRGVEGRASQYFTPCEGFCSPSASDMTFLASWDEIDR